MNGDGEPGPLPGQLILPGMPYPEPEPGAGQAVLPGLDDLRDPRPAADPELAAVAAELTALDGDGSRMAAAIRGALDMLLAAHRAVPLGAAARDGKSNSQSRPRRSGRVQQPVCQPE